MTLRDVPIKRKLMMVILMTTTFALLLMGGAIVAYEILTFRSTLAASTGVLAQIVGANSTGALAFDNPEDAGQVLRALGAERQITHAGIYDRDGKLFARFPASAPAEEFPPSPRADGHVYFDEHLAVFQPIAESGKRLGTIYLRASTDAMYARIRIYVALVLFAGAAAVLGAVVLSTKIQQRISRPIVQLADVARVVSTDRDYSVRATKHGADEIGDLTDAFNQMLTQIGEASEDLKKAKEAAESANSAKDHFLAVLSHELRTPLTPVLATVAMLQDDEGTPPEVRENLEVIRRNIDFEARLIDDLLDVTRVARGKLELHRQIMDVCFLVEHAVHNCRRGEASEKGLHLTFENIATETHVEADSSRLTQVFWNLLQNAAKFTPQGGNITIRIANEFADPPTNVSGHGDSAPPRPFLVISISDTGIGIEPDVLPRIFDAFEQGERARTRRFGGLGLGLAICRAIVSLHGGVLSAASGGRDQGATFSVRLQTAPALAALPPPTTDPRTIPVPNAPRSLRILLVEDHPDTAAQLQRLLTRSGHQVTCAGSVATGEIEAAAGAHNPQRQYDLVISDLGLPDGSGHDLMRALSQRYHLPGIALSGYGMETDVQESRQAGFSRHLTKPVDWNDLKVAIREVTAEMRDEAPVT